MSDATLATILILTSAFLHACWNAGVKRSDDKLATVIFVTTYGGLLLLPFTLFVPLPDTELWGWIAASMACHLLYQNFLARALETNPLTVAYPIARGTGPFLVAIFAYFMLGDDITLIDLACISVLVAGIMFTISLKDAKDKKALLYPLATGLAIASYTIVDALAVRSAENAYTFIVWAGVMAGPPIMITGILQRGWGIVAASTRIWRKALPVTIAAHGGYSLALLAYTYGSLGEVAALRETSIVFAALIGALWLKEKLNKRKLGSILLIATGAIALRIL